MAATIGGGMAWAIPVRPDLLGQRLQDYAKVTPTLHALRLCHRFGKGPEVHVTKLPVELEQEIESLLIQLQRNAFGFSDWKDKFMHYEGRCAPMDHIPDCYSPLADACDDMDMCAACEEDYGYDTKACLNRCRKTTENKCYTCSQKLDPDNCQRTCMAERDSEMNQAALEWDMDDGLNPFEPDCEGWEKAIDQSENGAFAQYDKILRQDFGLEAFFSTTRISAQDADSWPRHKNHGYNSDKGLRTTLCYLTMQRNMASRKSYKTTDLEDDCGFFDITATRVLPIIPLWNKKSKEQALKLFRRALRILDLQPFVHPSQRELLAVPDSDDGELDVDPQKKQKGQGTRKIKWPALVTIMRADFSMG